MKTKAFIAISVAAISVAGVGAVYLSSNPDKAMARSDPDQATSRGGTKVRGGPLAADCGSNKSFDGPNCAQEEPEKP